MNVAWLKNSLKDKSKDVENILNEQLDIAETVIKASRTLFNSLHPSMLDEIGLESAIKWQMKNIFSPRCYHGHGSRCHGDSCPGCPELTSTSGGCRSP